MQAPSVGQGLVPADIDSFVYRGTFSHADCEEHSDVAIYLCSWYTLGGVYTRGDVYPLQWLFHSSLRTSSIIF